MLEYHIPVSYTHLDVYKRQGVAVVPTFDDEISSDSSYCATFQLVWNDMKNEIIKKDIVFNPEEIMATNLNKESFTEDMISDSYYFKAFGPKTIKLKEEIVNGIKEKFNQTSDILDDFDWGEDALDLSLIHICNLFDVAMVFALALMVALVSRYNMTEMFSKDNFTMVKNPGKENMEIITKDGQKINRYTPSEDQSQKSGNKGKKVGIAYQLENGEIIYVPEDK